MQPEWGPVRQLIEDALQQGIFPGAALCVRNTTDVLCTLELGAAELRPRQRPVRPDQPWDLASLTKVLGTTALCMSLVGDGMLDLDAPVAETLPDAPAGVTARQLLQHSSGLPAWRPLYQAVEAEGLAWGTSRTRALLMQRARTIPVEAAPGERWCYSDLGFLTLGALIEARSGQRIDRLWQTRVAIPSGADLRWGWPGAAATEDCPLRGRVVVGEVHDLNAAVMGGIAPHAGLFGSVEAVAALAAWQLRAFHGESAGLDPAVVRAFWGSHGPGSHRLGWDGVTTGASSAGPRWPLDGAGHLGFTGCSLWIAPRQQVVVAFLSNRVHPEVEGGAVPDAPLSKRYAALKALRPRLHTAVVEVLESMGRWRAG